MIMITVILMAVVLIVMILVIFMAVIMIMMIIGMMMMKMMMNIVIMILMMMVRQCILIISMGFLVLFVDRELILDVSWISLQLNDHCTIFFEM